MDTLDWEWKKVGKYWIAKINHQGLKLALSSKFSPKYFSTTLFYDKWNQ